MAVALALVTSVVYGTADFCGGLATKRASVLKVLLWAHGIGLIGVTAAAPFLADRIDARDLWIGVVAGLVGLVGLGLLYRGLAIGPMAVVAPISGLVTALVPVAWSLVVDGATFSPVVGVGMILALAAVVTTSWPDTGSEGDADESATRIGSSVILTSIGAGVGFGVLVLLYDQTSEAGAPWPIVSGRIATTFVLLVVLVGSVRRATPGLEWRAFAPIGALVPASLAGLADTLANVTLLFATLAADTASELSIVSVLMALYPAATVVWARVLLGEPFGRVRTIGMAIAFVAIALLTLG